MREGMNFKKLRGSPSKLGDKSDLDSTSVLDRAFAESRLEEDFDEPFSLSLQSRILPENISAPLERQVNEIERLISAFDRSCQNSTILECDTSFANISMSSSFGGLERVRSRITSAIPSIFNIEKESDRNPHLSYYVRILESGERIRPEDKQKAIDTFITLIEERKITFDQASSMLSNHPELRSMIQEPHLKR